jgi:hypothetical protein
MAKKRGRKKAAARRPERAEELRAAPRALLGRDAGAREVRPPREDASVEDPLGDWPEVTDNGEQR